MYARHSAETRKHPRLVGKIQDDRRYYKVNFFSTDFDFGISRRVFK